MEAWVFASWFTAEVAGPMSWPGSPLFWGLTLWSCDQQTETKRAIPAVLRRAPRTVDAAKRPALDAAAVLQATRGSVVVVESRTEGAAW